MCKTNDKGMDLKFVKVLTLSDTQVVTNSLPPKAKQSLMCSAKLGYELIF